MKSPPWSVQVIAKAGKAYRAQEMAAVLSGTEISKYTYSEARNGCSSLNNHQYPHVPRQNNSSNSRLIQK